MQFQPLTVRVLIQTISGWVDLNDLDAYEIAGDSFADRGQTFRRTEVANPFVDGTFVTHTSKENIVEIPNRWGIASPYPKKVVQDGKTVSVTVPATIKCHRLVAPHLIAALDELDSRGLLYLIKTVDGFFPKYKSSGKEPSSHLFGFGLDFNQVDLPKLSPGQVAERQKRGQPLPKLDDRVVAVFGKHGFSSGGDWADPYDPMHIEYSDRKALGLE